MCIGSRGLYHVSFPQSISRFCGGNNIGWFSGTSIDSQDTLNFSVLSGVHSMNEVFPFDRAAEAYEHMMSGKARFRVVLDIGK